MLERVFEPLMQGPVPLKRLQSGLGIGLALVRRLVKLHGGEVKAASAGLNCGSVFSFWIPRIEPQASSCSKAVVVLDGQLKRVYVEDNKDVRMAPGELLRFAGCDIVEVGDGDSTLSAVLQAKLDAVLKDIGLPDISGYEVARQLRAHPETRSIPLIALTGYGQLFDKATAGSAGFDAHLAKPVDQDELLHTIDEPVANARRVNASDTSV